MLLRPSTTPELRAARKAHRNQSPGQQGTRKERSEEGNSPMNCRSLEEFWAFYVSQHSKRSTRRWHFAGTLSALLCLLLALLLARWLFLILALLLAYGPACYSHFFVEGNAPSAFAHPLWSFLCDLKMFALMLAGRMDREIKRLGKRPVLHAY